MELMVRSAPEVVVFNCETRVRLVADGLDEHYLQEARSGADEQYGDVTVAVPSRHRDRVDLSAAGAVPTAITLIYMLALACACTPPLLRGARIGRFTLPIAAIAGHPAPFGKSAAEGLSMLILIEWSAAALTIAGFPLIRLDA